MKTLTARQIKVLDEIHFDKLATEGTLKIALAYHANTLNSIQKREKEFWSELAEHHNFDPYTRHKIENKNGFQVIIEVKED